MTTVKSLKNKIVECVIEIFTKNIGKKLGQKDILKTLGLDYDIWTAQAEMYKVMPIVEQQMRLTKEKEGVKIYYTNNPKVVHQQVLDAVNDARIDQITKDIQKISISISSLKSQMLDLPNKVAIQITNNIGSAILKKMTEELGEFFQDFVKDHKDIQNNCASLHKQNGMLISMVKELKVKSRILGGTH